MEIYKDICEIKDEINMCKTVRVKGFTEQEQNDYL